MHDARDVTSRWMACFAEAVEQRDVGAVDELFLADGWWRDLLACTWDLRTARGTQRLGQMLGVFHDAEPSGIALSVKHQPELVQPTEDVMWVQAIFTFETPAARCHGVVRLLPDPDARLGWSAWTVLTATDELKGFEEATGHRRPWGANRDHTHSKFNWLDRREWEQDYADREPTVLIVGAGQSGLAIAARLRMLGVDTLIVERNPRVGDNWRNRYRTLSLHDPVWFDHLPYLSYPPSWPVYTPKDKLAGWLESYAESMELNVWTSTPFLGGAFDEEAGRWEVRVDRGGEGERILRPTHVIMATGSSGMPKAPRIPGAEDFTGVLCHSTQHSGGGAYEGRKAVVIGTGNTGHDVAQDFYECGADTTLVQRGSTYVISIAATMRMFSPLYDEDGPPTEDADLLALAFPIGLTSEMGAAQLEEIQEFDRELLDGLAAAGFRTNDGIDGRGLITTYVQRGGGYYMDIGCSQLIIDGRVKVRTEEIERITPTGIRFADGSEIEADIIVLATGYHDLRHTTRTLLGDEVADRVRPVGGLDEEGELGCLWRESGFPNYWLMAGSFQYVRMYSKFLALRIKAIEEGVRGAELPTLSGQPAA
jgi:putative flavoprotein involved in K+ transport